MSVFGSVLDGVGAGLGERNACSLVRKRVNAIRARLQILRWRSGATEPPQSTSVSLPLITRSVQLLVRACLERHVTDSWRSSPCREGTAEIRAGATLIARQVDVRFAAFLTRSLQAASGDTDDIAHCRHRFVQSADSAQRSWVWRKSGKWCRRKIDVCLGPILDRVAATGHETKDARNCWQTNRSRSRRCGEAAAAVSAGRTGATTTVNVRFAAVLDAIAAARCEAEM